MRTPSHILHFGLCLFLIAATATPAKRCAATERQQESTSHYMPAYHTLHHTHTSHSPTSHPSLHGIATPTATTLSSSTMLAPQETLSLTPRIFLHHNFLSDDEAALLTPDA